ncbi:MAG TPA: endonuclease [Chryseobacterium sp.]|nr:endonuclease [Chryseobacterium sp.]
MVDQAASEILMFYNTENFYPPDKDGLPNCGMRNWDDYKYKLKLHKIVQVFNLINDNYNGQPALIGLAEIGDLSVLEDLVSQNSVIKDYGIIYQKSADPRNLSVAILYNSSVFSLVNFQVLRFHQDNQNDIGTRDILHAEMIYKGKTLHIFVLHLPSKRDRDVKKDLRHRILGQLKETVQNLIKNDEEVIIMGDFNEDPDSEILQQFLHCKNKDRILENPFIKFFEAGNFSTYHGKKGSCFDQIIFTNSLRTTFGFDAIEADICRSEKLRNQDRKNKQYPYRTYSGSRYMGGYSDHFPIVIKLLQNPQP